MSTRVCRYDITIERTAEVEVAVRCDGNQVRAFVETEPAAIEHVNGVAHAGGARLARGGPRFELPAGASADIRYRIDLDALARDVRDPDVCLRAGDAWIASGSAFLLQPEPVAKNARVELRVHSELDFATALEQTDEGVYRLDVREIPFATYAVFGDFEHDLLTMPGPLSLDPQLQRAGAAPESRIDVVTLPGNYAVARATRLEWLRDASVAVSHFWGGFPVDHTMIAIVPAADHGGVAQGKVVAAGGPAVAIHLGEEADRTALYRDWVLVHELFHLGFPSFWREGKWLDEGLATYYEPIIRARAGWRSEEALWREFAFDMEQGLEAVQQSGVELAKSHRGVYWGGAIIALLADVRARELTSGRLGLEDGLRALLARGGDASHVWRLEDAIAIIDGHLGAPILRELSDAHRYGGQPVNLYGLLDELGVTRTRSWVVLDDASNLSDVRRAILAPPG